MFFQARVPSGVWMRFAQAMKFRHQSARLRL